jgi:uncharacterized damage-inducible protein DinB
LHILEGVNHDLAHNRVDGAPHTIYDEVWHLAYWQQVSIDWANGVETPVPASASMGFPSPQDKEKETWDQLRKRFLEGCEIAAAIARDEERLTRQIRCPSVPGKPIRIMSVRDQLESLASHNHYHLGRVVLLRQLNRSWPPVSGGFTW